MRNGAAIWLPENTRFYVSLSRYRMMSSPAGCRASFVGQRLVGRREKEENTGASSSLPEFRHLHWERNKPLVNKRLDSHISPSRVQPLPRWQSVQLQIDLLLHPRRSSCLTSTKFTASLRLVMHAGAVSKCPLAGLLNWVSSSAVEEKCWAF